MTDVLWMMPGKGYSDSMRPVVEKMIKAVGLQKVWYTSLHHKVQKLTVLKGKVKQVLNQAVITEAKAAMDYWINTLQPKVIVINDTATLWLIAGEGYSLDLCRGSIYYYKKIPCVVVNDPSHLFTVRHAKWVFSNDLRKIKRWVDGKRRTEPAFSYTVCRSLSDVEAAERAISASPFVAIDSETKGGFITCIGYTCFRGLGLHTFIIPFFDPFAENGCIWQSVVEEVSVWETVRRIHAGDNTKILQNGVYDCAYFIACGVPLRNYFIDTSNLMHSVYREAPKKLNFISSIFMDYCRYWKDESKGSKEDGWGNNRSTLDRYWRYCALDCYNTFLNAYYLSSLVLSQEWAKVNYDNEFRLAVGPCLAMSMRGMRADSTRHSYIIGTKERDADRSLAIVRTMVDNPEFNVRAPADVAHILYDVLGAQPTRLQRKNGKYGPRSTDEKVLKLIREQGNPLFGIFIDAVLAAKQPASDISKYGNRYEMFRVGRFYYSLSASATDTARFGGGSHAFWIGTNPQNIPPEMREYLVADDDYVLCEIDYSASDDVFVAYEAQDPDKIRVVTSGIDVHSYHASHFFKMPYQKIYDAAQAKEEWCVHPTKGVRMNTKRVGHGKNFLMQEGTLYNTMGREAVVATALAMGYKNAGNLSDKALIGICKILGDMYDDPVQGLYKRLRAWQGEIIQNAIKCKNIVTVGFGNTRLFFADLKNDVSAQREIAAQYGQGDTAGNINRSVNELYYSGLDDGKTVILLLQCHDSLTLAIHKDHLHKIAKIQEIMERSTVIHGREMHVNAEPEVGLTWSKKMLKWKPETTYEDVVAFEQKTFGKKFAIENYLEQLKEIQV